MNNTVTLIQNNALVQNNDEEIYNLSNRLLYKGEI